jgi:arylsulfatase I/J
MRAHVSGLDHAIGQIINGLKMRGFWENTILIFSNDNGGLTKYDWLANAPLKGRKGLGLDSY